MVLLTVPVIIGITVAVVLFIVLLSVLIWSITKNNTSALVCQNDGELVHGICHCTNEWTGTTCEIPALCEGGCAHGGTCDHGICHCAGDWSGPTCETPGKEVCTPPCGIDETCQHGDCHPIKHQVNATIVIRHGAKYESKCNECCQSLNCECTEPDCTLCCRVSIIQELNTLEYDIPNNTFINLTTEGISQANEFPTSIAMLMDRYNLSPVTSAYTVDFNNGGNANTMLTSSPYLSSIGFSKQSVQLYSTPPTLEKPTDGSVFIAGNADTLFGGASGSRPNCPNYGSGSIFQQLCDLYKVCPEPCFPNQPDTVIRGRTIYIFTEDGLYTKCEQDTSTQNVNCVTI